VSGTDSSIAYFDTTDIKEKVFMNIIRGVMRKFSIAGELLGFFGQRRWWVLPTIIAVLLLGILFIVGEATSLAPFIYTMF
jgi:hypothetical protein